MDQSALPPPSLSELFRVFGRIGLLSFGGPAAQIALMHKELVEDRPWLSEKQYLDALSFCMLLPGPEAMQLATYAGWRLHGVIGGLIGGLLFVLPGALVMTLLSLTYAFFGQVPLVEALFLGIKATVVIIVLQALLKLGQKALKTTDRWILAGLSFVGIFFLALPFPMIIAAAAAYGYFRAEPSTDLPPKLAKAHTSRTIAIWLCIWAAPVLVAWLSGATFLSEIALFFSKLAVVTFGGAYAVLAYMTQEVVSGYAWLSTAEMMDGLGLAETTPGPLILVTQFVGMLAGFKEDGLGTALWAGALTLWVTFIPCFLWIFTGAPFIDWISSRARLRAALNAITAAVVGVILNLSVWFAVHVFFADVTNTHLGPLRLVTPRLTSLELPALLLALLAGILLIFLKWPLPRVLALVAVLGASLTTLL